MKISKAVFVVVDTESTGLDPKQDQLLEIAAVATSLDWPNLGMWSTLVKPTIAIPAEASAIHGLTAGDVERAPDRAEALDRFVQFVERFSSDVVAAHHAVHDKPFLGFDDALHVPRIDFLCTERMAQHLWPEAPNYKNQTLRYWRGLHPQTHGIPPHRGLGDALATVELLRDELRCVVERGIDDTLELQRFCDAPILFKKWPFGKHRGDPIEAAPGSYISWCLRDMKDLSPDMRFTLEQALQVGVGAA